MNEARAEERQIVWQSALAEIHVLVGIVSPSDVARTVQTAELRLPVGKAA